MTFNGFGPIAFIKHQRSPVFEFLLIPEVYATILGLAEAVDLQNLLVYSSNDNVLMGDFCVNEMSLLCIAVVEAIVGFDKPINFNGTTMSVMASHEPGGTSLQNLNHWA